MKFFLRSKLLGPLPNSVEPEAVAPPLCRRLEIYSLKRTKLRVLELEISGLAEDGDTLLKMAEE